MDFYLTYQINETEIIFTMAAPTRGYVSIGISMVGFARMSSEGFSL
jgi:hypothetical protein